MAGEGERSVTLERVGFARYRATNVRGGSIEFGEGGDGTDFTALELLLTALGGCSAADVDHITSRRAAPESFTVEVAADKVSDDHGNRLVDIRMTFRVRFPTGPEGDAARTRLPAAVRRSHDRLCTVTRTVEIGTPVSVTVD